VYDFFPLTLLLSRGGAGTKKRTDRRAGRVKISNSLGSRKKRERREIHEGYCSKRKAGVLQSPEVMHSTFCEEKWHEGWGFAGEKIFSADPIIVKVPGLHAQRRWDLKQEACPEMDITLENVGTRCPCLPIDPNKEGRSGQQD